MATQKERILEYLRSHPDGADDDVLAAALEIPHRQAVNQICRRLASEGLLVRRPDPVAGKIVNNLVSPRPPTLLSQQEPLATASAAVPVVSSHSPTGGRRLNLLTGTEDVRRFTYSGEVGLTEDQVKAAVEAALLEHGWRVQTRWGRAPGIDIEAHRGAERLVLEAKGEGSLQPMRVNYFVGALGELLQRMESPAASYGLALPAHRQFVGLVLRLPDWVKTRLNLCFFLVRPAPGGYEVGLCDWSHTLTL